VEEAEAAETLPAETTETETTETETTVTETTATETTATETTETETTETETTETEPSDTGAGKAVFASAGCGSCHALADADAAGAVGPDLDSSMPSVELVVDRVTNGQGAMPAFADQLSEAEIAAVADYVASVAGS
jgi:mono/diheme cytochrome c family protein